MLPVLGMLLTLLFAYGYAIAVRPLLGIPGRLGLAIGIAVAFAALLFPLAIQSDHVVLRALASFACVELFFKMLDFARVRSKPSVDVGGYGKYLHFLMPFPVLLVVWEEKSRPRVRPPSYLAEFLLALPWAAVSGICVCLIFIVPPFSEVMTIFAFDHAFKLLLFAVMIESLSMAMHRIERIAGYDTAPLVQNAISSLTPADFWKRYNTRVHAWLDLNVFRPTGGRRHPMRGILITFLVSAIFHELMFDLATSSLTGYQFLFFACQAPAVMLSSRLKRLAKFNGVPGTLFARCVTIIWFAVTSVLFFDGVQRVFPFYYTSQRFLP
jgi:hypothetical protein